MLELRDVSEEEPTLLSDQLKGPGRISDDPTVSSLGDWEGDETIELGDT